MLKKNDVHNIHEDVLDHLDRQNKTYLSVYSFNSEDEEDNVKCSHILYILYFLVLLRRLMALHTHPIIDYIILLLNTFLINRRHILTVWSCTSYYLHGNISLSSFWPVYCHHNTNISSVSLCYPLT
jgi:hypothetical protein